MLLTGNNSYSGVTTVAGGILTAGSNTALGTANNTDGSGTIVSAATNALLELSGVTIAGESLRFDQGKLRSKAYTINRSRCNTRRSAMPMHTLDRFRRLAGRREYDNGWTGLVTLRNNANH